MWQFSVKYRVATRKKSGRPERKLLAGGWEEAEDFFYDCEGVGGLVH